ncbi:MAG: TIGR00730 family Rossman fold protein [Spirochaetaceae bacterium]
MKRLCVYCGSSRGNEPRFEHAAAELGREMARLGIELVYGGGRAGLMGVVSSEVMRRGGKAYGVIPRHLMTREIAHTDLTELIEVETMHERKAMMIDRADAFVALPGGLGTLEEISEVLSWAQIGLHNKPIGLVNSGGFYDPFVRFVDHLVSAGFVSPSSVDLLLLDASPLRLLERLIAAAQ